MKPPSLKWGDERILNSAVDPGVNGLPNRTPKKDNKTCVYYFFYPPWAASGWSGCVLLCSDPFFRVNTLIRQLLEYWLPRAQSSGNCLACGCRLSGDGLPPMTVDVGIQSLAPLTQSGTTQKGHPRSRIPNRISRGLSFCFSLCPILPSLFSYRCISQLHPSVNLLDAIFYFRI